MRIGIDCRLGGISHAGIGRYIEHLVTHLPLRSDITWVLFYRDREQLSWMPTGSQFEKIHAPVTHYSIAEQIQMPGIFQKAELDLLHVPHFNVPLLYTGPVVVTIHDLLWHEQQGSHVTTLSPMIYALKYRAYRWVTSHALRSARRVIVPSQTVKETIERIVPIAKEKMTVIYEGVDPEWFRPIPKQSSPSKSIVYTGSLYPHKNVDELLQALCKMTDYRLTIVSARNVFTTRCMDEVRRLGIEDQVHFAGKLSDHDLRVLYAKSDVLVQPSRSEGFGLTGVEAMAYGLPVVASDIPIFHEVYGDHAVFFPLGDKDGLVEAIKHAVLMTPKEKSDAQEYVRRYDWKKMTASIVELYLHAISKV